MSARVSTVKTTMKAASARKASAQVCRVQHLSAEAIVPVITTTKVAISSVRAATVSSARVVAMVSSVRVATVSSARVVAMVSSARVVMVVLSRVATAVLSRAVMVVLSRAVTVNPMDRPLRKVPVSTLPTTIRMQSTA